MPKRFIKNVTNNQKAMWFLIRLIRISIGFGLFYAGYWFGREVGRAESEQSGLQASHSRKARRVWGTTEWNAIFSTCLTQAHVV